MPACPADDQGPRSALRIHSSLYRKEQTSRAPAKCVLIVAENPRPTLASLRPPNPSTQQDDRPAPDGALARSMHSVMAERANGSRLVGCRDIDKYPSDKASSALSLSSEITALLIDCDALLTEREEVSILMHSVLFAGRCSHLASKGRSRTTVCITNRTSLRIPS